VKGKTSCGGTLPKEGCSNVKSFYSVMDCHNGLWFPWKSVWRTKVPLRVASSTFFVVGGRREDPYLRQSLKAARYGG
jgi:hypothetical protein